jgi:hypothetical protein
MKANGGTGEDSAAAGEEGAIAVRPMLERGRSLRRLTPANDNVADWRSWLKRLILRPALRVLASLAALVAATVWLITG